MNASMINALTERWESSMPSFFSAALRRAGLVRREFGIDAGSYFPNRDQPALSKDDRVIVNRFHDLYYRRWMSGDADTKNLSWFGYHTLKCPLDLWIYQELIVQTRPDVIVETGTYHGGSALYLATILEMLGHGSVVTIDTETMPGRPDHPRIRYLNGSSVSTSMTDEVKRIVGRQRAMVILDSDHREDHVFQELAAYSSLIHPGDYLIVEDTNIHGHPTYLEFGPGPMEAVTKFLLDNTDFEIDERCERFMMTLNPRGYLRKKSQR